MPLWLINGFTVVVLEMLIVPQKDSKGGHSPQRIKKIVARHPVRCRCGCVPIHHTLASENRSAPRASLLRSNVLMSAMYSPRIGTGDQYSGQYQSERRDGPTPHRQDLLLRGCAFMHPRCDEPTRLFRQRVVPQRRLATPVKFRSCLAPVPCQARTVSGGASAAPTGSCRRGSSGAGVEPQGVIVPLGGVGSAHGARRRAAGMQIEVAPSRQTRARLEGLALLLGRVAHTLRARAAMAHERHVLFTLGDAWGTGEGDSGAGGTR